jgi:pimeloyl-ACP methyl ester carboxylesterase
MAIANLFMPKNRSIFPKEIKTITQDALNTSLQGIIAALEGMKIRKDRQDFFKSSAYKKMLILGKNDPVLDYKNLVLQMQHTNVEVVEFPDGHMSHIENKCKFLQKIMYFVEK